MLAEIQQLTAFTRDLQRRLTLEEMLQIVVDRAAALLATGRVSARLLDATRTRLLVSARAGESLHDSPIVEFKIGEGLIGWVAAQARPLRLSDPERDPRFQPRAHLKDRMGSFLGVPLLSDDQSIGVLAAVSPAADAFTAEHEELLALLAGICAPHVEIARLSRLAQVDALTGALNRHGLALAFPEAAVLSVAMADVDHFKPVNDAHGHAAGDEVLRAVARLLSSVLRAGDAVVRYGGEEFLLILPGIDLHRAGHVAERARKAVEECTLDVGGAPVRVSISLGVAERSPGEPRDRLIERADQALYAAKQAGRNRVVFAPAAAGQG